ncbi:MAG: hypothetical protein RXR43_15995 [Sulfolobus sp.]
MEKKFNRCLVVSRHQLLQLQQQDINEVCQEITITPELPTEPAKLKEIVSGYDAIIGSLPINIIQLIQNSGKVYITFNMKSLGVYSDKGEVDKLVSQYGEDRVAVLTPSKPSEPYRVTLYMGLKQIRVTIEETTIIEHK